MRKLGSYKKNELGVTKSRESAQLKQDCRKLWQKSSKKKKNNNIKNANGSSNYDDGDDSNNSDNSSAVRTVANERSQFFGSCNSFHTSRRKSNAKEVHLRSCIGSMSDSEGPEKKPKFRNRNFACLASSTL